MPATPNPPPGEGLYYPTLRAHIADEPHTAFVMLEGEQRKRMRITMPSASWCLQKADSRGQSH